MRVPANLKQLYRAGCVIPFVGAGASKAITWTENGEPHNGLLWEALVDQAITQLGFEEPRLARVRGTDLQILEYYKLRHSGEFAELTNWLHRHMEPPDDSILTSTIHRELAALLHCRLVYTTNFDDLIERSLRLHGRSTHVVAVEADMGRNHGKEVEVVKFHGDWDHPHQMVLSESDFESRLSLATPLDHRFRADLMGRVALFIGYSFRDPNVSYLFRNLSDELKSLPTSADGRRAYIVVPEPSDFEIRLFGTRNIEVIDVGTEDVEENVAAVLAEMRE